MIKLEISLEDTNKIIYALLELPAKYSMDIINNIRKQSIPQIDIENEKTK